MKRWRFLVRTHTRDGGHCESRRWCTFSASPHMCFDCDRIWSTFSQRAVLKLTSEKDFLHAVITQHSGKTMAYHNYRFLSCSTEWSIVFDCCNKQHSGVPPSVAHHRETWPSFLLSVLRSYLPESSFRMLSTFCQTPHVWVLGLPRQAMLPSEKQISHVQVKNMMLTLYRRSWAVSSLWNRS